MYESAQQHNKRLEKNWWRWFEILNKTFPHLKTIPPALCLYFFAQEGCIDDNDDNDDTMMLNLMLMLSLMLMLMRMLNANADAGAGDNADTTANDNGDDDGGDVAMVTLEM